MYGNAELRSVPQARR